MKFVLHCKATEEDCGGGCEDGVHDMLCLSFLRELYAGLKVHVKPFQLQVYIPPPSKMCFIINTRTALFHEENVEQTAHQYILHSSCFANSVYRRTIEHTRIIIMLLTLYRYKKKTKCCTYSMDFAKTVVSYGGSVAVQMYTLDVVADYRLLFFLGFISSLTFLRKMEFFFCGLQYS